MTRRIIAIFFVTAILGCQTDKKDTGDKKNILGESIALDKAKNTDILDLLNKVPEADVDFHFNTIADNLDTTQLVFLPDNVIDKIESESVYNFESNHPQEMKNIRQFRDAYNSSNIVRIGFYRLLPFTPNTYDILTAFVMNSKTGHGSQEIEWQILTFNKNGKQISSLDRLHEMYTYKDTLIGLWWYASNEYPHYETWIKNKGGIFNMTLQSEDVPSHLKGQIKE